MWKIWCRTIGSKISDDDKEADKAAMMRTFWVVIHLVTCFHIIANTWRHW